MSNLYTKDRLIGLFIDAQERNTTAFQELKGAINALNEQGRLHTECIKNNTEKTDETADAIKSLIQLNKLLYKILIALLAIVAIAAGAEQVLKLGLFQ